jgi:hypothetical protein
MEATPRSPVTTEPRPPREPARVRARAPKPEIVAAAPPVEGPETASAPSVVTEPAPEPEPRPAARVVDAAEWRAHAVELDAARGPKPIAVIEKLFMTRYCPLLAPVATGAADAAVREVVDDWRTSFEHSYKDAFAALRVTGKRPPMVFDAPEIAARMARLNGARKTMLLLVDGMRFDLGERIVERLKTMTTGRALCVDRVLLWSALPTTTPTQAALLARGPEGMKDAAPSSEPAPMIERGRAVATIRRERVGSREVMKLDLVEARLRTAGPATDERLDKLADEVAPVVARHIETLAPRTLLFLFGDHGFRLPTFDAGRATGPATQGGASPEEVLVPGYAWLVDGVH